MTAIDRSLRTQAAARGILLIVALVVVFDAYHFVLKMYLVDLDRPLVMEFVFIGSAIIACLYEFNGGSWKVNLSGCLATLTLFAVGALLACWLRVQYMEFVAAIKAAPDFSDVVGRDVYHALTARAVGYGGCYAIGMLIARTTLAKWTRRRITSYFAPVTQKSCPTCGGCGHVTL